MRMQAYHAGNLIKFSAARLQPLSTTYTDPGSLTTVTHQLYEPYSYHTTVYDKLAFGAA